MARGPQETPKRPASRAAAAPPAATPKPADEPTAAAVVDYLRRHPDLLRQQPELLDRLELPAGDAKVVDLRAVLVERLRGQLAAMAALRDEMVTAGRGNLQIQARTHEAVLALLSARSFEQLIERATGDLATILDVDVAALGVERVNPRTSEGALPPVRLGGVFQLEPGTVEALIGTGRQTCLRPATNGDPLLYGAGAGLVRSDALVRLSISRQTPAALLALGARDEGHFHPGQGTELLQFLGAVLTEQVRAWLDLPE